MLHKNAAAVKEKLFGAAAEEDVVRAAQDAACWLVYAGRWAGLGAACCAAWLLCCTGCWVLDAGRCWVLGAGCCAGCCAVCCVLGAACVLYIAQGVCFTPAAHAQSFKCPGIFHLVPVASIVLLRT